MSVNALKPVKTGTQTVRFLLKTFGSSPEKRQLLLKETGLNQRMIQAAGGQISALSELVMIENLSRLYGRDWVFHYKDVWEGLPKDALSTSLIHAHSLGDGLNVVTRFGYVWSPFLYFERFDGPDHIFSQSPPDKVFLSIDIIPGLKQDKGFRQSALMRRDIAVLRLHNLISRHGEQALAGASIELDQAANVPAKRYRTGFLCPVNTGRTRCGLLLSRESCQRAASTADASRFNKAVMSLHKLNQEPPSIDSIVRNVRDYLNSITNKRPTIEETARALNLSGRTLNRRLQASGTSFRQLLEKSLEIRARKLMATTRLSRGEISEKLGYSDQASFSRALKRWRHND